MPLLAPPNMMLPLVPLLGPNVMLPLVALLSVKLVPLLVTISEMLLHVPVVVPMFGDVATGNEDCTERSMYRSTTRS